MYRSLLFLGPALLSLPLVGRAGAEDDARCIVERAVGGADKLDEFKAVHAKYEGAAFINDVRAPCTLEAWLQFPSQLKTIVRYEYRGKKDTLIQVVNGDKAWRREAGQTQEATGPGLTELMESFHVQRVEALVPLLKDKRYTLSRMDDTNVESRPAQAVKVTSKGHVDVSLYFDKETGFLVKSEHWLPDLTGKKVFRESRFTDFREINGLKQSTRLLIYHDTKKILDVRQVELRFLHRIEASEFTKP